MKLIKNIQIYKVNATFKCGIVVYFYLNCSFHSVEIKPSLEIQLTKRHYEKALNQQQRCDLLRFWLDYTDMKAAAWYNNLRQWLKKDRKQQFSL